MTMLLINFHVFVARRVPLDAAQGRAGDEGEPTPSDSISGVAWKKIVGKVISAVER